MLRTRLFVAGAVLLSAVTAHAAGKIVVTLDGKPTTSVACKEAREHIGYMGHTGGGGGRGQGFYRLRKVK